jgi:hypothetical protein
MIPLLVSSNVIPEKQIKYLLHETFDAQAVFLERGFISLLKIEKPVGLLFYDTPHRQTGS